MTPIETYLSERGRMALGIVGPVEWTEEYNGKPHRLSLARVDETKWYSAGWKAVGVFGHNLTDHEAACLISNHIREWLEKHGVAVETEVDDKPVYRVYNWNTGGFLVVYGDAAMSSAITHEWDDADRASEFETHALAQIEAVHAIGGLK